VGALFPTPPFSRGLAGRAEGGSEKRSESCDAAGGDANADFNGGPDGEVGGAVEKFAFVGFE
jgi:hypothetical protein